MLPEEDSDKVKFIRLCSVRIDLLSGLWFPDILQDKMSILHKFSIIGEHTRFHYPNRK